MNIEVVCPSRELYGSDRSAVRLATLLRGLGHAVRLALPQQRPERGLTELAGSVGIEAEALPLVVASRRGISGMRMRRSRSEADLTVYNSLAVAARPGDRRPRVIIVREWLDPSWRRHRALSRWHRDRTDLAVAVSEGVARQWRACAGDVPPVDVCPNWIDDHWLDLDPAGERHGVLFAGRFSHWKGQTVLADAFERAFRDSSSAPQLSFLGAESSPSPFARYADELRERAAGRGCAVLEFDPDPLPIFARSALVVVPSLRPEPFGNVVLEALAGGARVIAFGGGGIDDLAPLFSEAIELCERDTGALATALARWWAAGGAGQSEAEHERSRATLRERFSAAAAAPRWQRILAGLAG